MSEASSDRHSQPRQVAQPRNAQVVPRHADEEEEVDPRLEAVLSADNPVYPLDPPIADVRIPVEAPHAADAARDWMDAARRWIAKLEEQLRRLDRS